MASSTKRIRKSDKFKYVSLHTTSQRKETWKVSIFGNSKYYETEREAAIAVDKTLINNGKNPVNILIKKL